MSENSDGRPPKAEEDRLYRKRIETIRAGVANGVNFDRACELVTVEDGEMRAMIIDDALKIEIAELHYGKGLPLLDVAKKLGVSMERLLRANSEMMEDILNTAEEVAKQQAPRSEKHIH